MAIRFSGNVSELLVSALVGVVLQAGWDVAHDWLGKQGIFAQQVPNVPQQLPGNHPYNYVSFESGFFYWHFVDA